jgi:hypothetical protein
MRSAECVSGFKRSQTEKYQRKLHPGGGNCKLVPDVKDRITIIMIGATMNSKRTTVAM